MVRSTLIEDSKESHTKQEYDLRRGESRWVTTSKELASRTFHVGVGYDPPLV